MMMNNSQLLIIHKYPILFNILNENKSTLKFKILQINEDKVDINTSYENLVIISSDKNSIPKNAGIAKKIPNFIAFEIL